MKPLKEARKAAIEKCNNPPEEQEEEQEDQEEPEVPEGCVSFDGTAADNFNTL